MQKPNDRDNALIREIVDDVLPRAEATHSGREFVPGTPQVRVNGQFLHRISEARGVGISLPLAPPCRGIGEQRAKVILGFRRDFESTV